jgi:DNA repair exonuclease SbcCD ATPase subunit
MGDTIRVNISSFEVKKSVKGAADMKDMLKSEIKVEVVDGSKNIDPRLYSDGETAKISNAIIRGLYDVASASGQGSNVLLLDEIFSYVDPDNAQKVADSFKKLQAPTTLVTDNSGHVCNLMRFDATWVVQKLNGMTTVLV